jgi:hypothetical protein
MNKKIDFLITILLVFLTVGYGFLLNGYWIGRSLFVVFFLCISTGLYLGFREQKNWKKLVLGSLIFGCIFGFALSFFAESTGAWTTNSYIFNFRFFGVNTLEEVLGQGLMAFYTFLFYEHFLDDEKERRLNKKYLWGFVIGIIGSLFLVSYYLLHGPVSLPYAYIWPATIALIPTIVMVIRHPSLLTKLALLSLFSLFLWFLMECLAVSYNYWSYPGEYLGWVQFLSVRFPVEELIFWMLLYSPTIVAYYEATIDDGV